MTTRPLHMVIIAAGTGGMCLAHGLKKAGISVAVYERDRTKLDFLQGHRVGIDPHGTRALHECLPDDLFETFLATCAKPMRRGNQMAETVSPSRDKPNELAVDILSFMDGIQVNWIRDPAVDQVESWTRFAGMYLT